MIWACVANGSAVSRGFSYFQDLQVGQTAAKRTASYGRPFDNLMYQRCRTSDTTTQPQKHGLVISPSTMQSEPPTTDFRVSKCWYSGVVAPITTLNTCNPHLGHREVVRTCEALNAIVPCDYIGLHTILRF